MSKNVVIIDYQLGNLFSVQQSCAHLGHTAQVSSDPDVLRKADMAILPGVGAFADAMNSMRQLGLADALQEYVADGRPLMGVCLGLQLLMTESEEFGDTKGLNIIPGTVRRFQVQEVGGHVHKVPQIQWNTITEPAPGRWAQSPLRHCQSGDFMYFVHSFYTQPADERHVLSKTTYGTQQYCSAVQLDNVFATQFHPEKSGLYGVRIYEEWFNQHSK